MAAASRTSLLLAAAVAALCALQMSEAGSHPTTDTISASLSQLQRQTEDSINKQKEEITEKVEALEADIEGNFTAEANKVRAKVNALVEEAEYQGFTVANCALNATLRLAKLAADLPVSLAHCFTDNADAFDYYEQKINADFDEGFRAIGEAVYAISNCPLLSYFKCAGKINTNLTKFEADIALDVSFQLFDMSTAGINLVATVTLCDTQTLAQALLDQAMVVPDTAACIAKDKEQQKSQGGDSSSR